MKAVGYIRVSTAGQAVDGAGLGVQRERIGSWCRAAGYELIAMHVDAGVSGARMGNRAGLRAAIADATRQNGALVRLFAVTPGAIDS